jgi:chemotaxis protein CheY-P-specific phosphatase CheC
MSMAVRIDLSGGVAGSVLLLVPDADAVVALLRAPRELAESAIAEVGNVVSSHLVVGLEEHVERQVQITPPSVTRDVGDVDRWIDVDARGGRSVAWVELRGECPVVLVLAVDLVDPVDSS